MSLAKGQNEPIAVIFQWRPGPTHIADYWTKYHTAAHHKRFKGEILTSVKLVENLFGSGDNLL